MLKCLYVILTSAYRIMDFYPFQQPNTLAIFQEFRNIYEIHISLYMFILILDLIHMQKLKRNSVEKIMNILSFEIEIKIIGNMKYG